MNSGKLETKNVQYDKNGIRILSSQETKDLISGHLDFSPPKFHKNNQDLIDLITGH